MLGVLLLGAIAVAVAFAFAAQARPQAVVAPVDAPVESAPGGPEGTAPGSAPSPGPTDTIVVDVAGRVRDPGLVEVPAGSRVNDAIEAAGGFRKKSDALSVNLARLIVDGEQIVVGEPVAGQAAAGGGAAPTLVSLSAATAEQLEQLPGVGPVLAQRIIDHRTSIGGRFTSIEQLRDVTGIGDVTYADLEARVQP